VDPILVEEDYIRFKVRLGFSADFCKTFEEGAERLLDEIGPRPGTHPALAGASAATVLIQCDAEASTRSDRICGIIEFGLSKLELPDRVGLPLILAVASYVSAYSFIVEYQLKDIHFPKSVLDSGAFPGPKLGPSLVSGRTSTRLGALIKPRFMSDLGFLRDFVVDAAKSEIDYLVDDELTVGSRAIPFEAGVETIMKALLSEGHKQRPAYIANIAGDHRGAMERAYAAQELGADGVMVNSFTMGYDAVQDLARDSSFRLGVVSNGLGLGVLTKGPEFRVSTEVLVRLARLSGSDAVYTGPIVGLIDSSQHSAAQFRRALTQPYERNCTRLPSAAVMAGGVGLPEILQNEALYRGPLFLSMGYQFSEIRLGGTPAPVIVNCIRTIWDAVRLGGVDQGRDAVQSLARKGGVYRDCLRAIRAEEALSR
jgi:Ribulose bisphosphate carboxylase large chain, catalytic domain